MEIYLQLQDLPIAASVKHIRQFFSKFQIPDGGVEIHGGPKGIAFIQFSDKRELLHSLEYSGEPILGVPVKLFLARGGEGRLEPFFASRPNRSGHNSDKTDNAVTVRASKQGSDNSELRSQTFNKADSSSHSSHSYSSSASDSETQVSNKRKRALVCLYKEKNDRIISSLSAISEPRLSESDRVRHRDEASSPDMKQRRLSDCADNTSYHEQGNSPYPHPQNVALQEPQLLSHQALQPDSDQEPKVHHQQEIPQQEPQVPPHQVLQHIPPQESHGFSIQQSEDSLQLQSQYIAPPGPQGLGQQNILFPGPIDLPPPGPPNFQTGGPNFQSHGQQNFPPQSHQYFPPHVPQPQNVYNQWPQNYYSQPPPLFPPRVPWNAPPPGQPNFLPQSHDPWNFHNGPPNFHNVGPPNAPPPLLGPPNFPPIGPLHAPPGVPPNFPPIGPLHAPPGIPPNFPPRGPPHAPPRGPLHAPPRGPPNFLPRGPPNAPPQDFPRFQCGGNRNSRPHILKYIGSEQQLHKYSAGGPQHALNQKLQNSHIKKKLNASHQDLNNATQQKSQNTPQQELNDMLQQKSDGTLKQLLKNTPQRQSPNAPDQEVQNKDSEQPQSPPQQQVEIKDSEQPQSAPQQEVQNKDSEQPLSVPQQEVQNEDREQDCEAEKASKRSSCCVRIMWRKDPKPNWKSVRAHYPESKISMIIIKRTKKTTCFHVKFSTAPKGLVNEVGHGTDIQPVVISDRLFEKMLHRSKIESGYEVVDLEALGEGSFAESEVVSREALYKMCKRCLKITFDFTSTGFCPSSKVLVDFLVDCNIIKMYKKRSDGNVMWYYVSLSNAAEHLKDGSHKIQGLTLSVNTMKLNRFLHVLNDLSKHDISYKEVNLGELSD